MAETTTLRGTNLHVDGRLSAGTLVLATGGISNTHVSDGADIDRSKMTHEHVLTYTTNILTATDDNSDVWTIDLKEDRTIPIYIARGSGNILSLEAAAGTVPTTGNTDTLDIDVERWEGTAWTSATSATIEFSDSSAINTVYAATIDTDEDDFADGDIIRLNIDYTAGTAAGSGVDDLIVTVVIEEDATT